MTAPDTTVVQAAGGAVWRRATATATASGATGPGGGGLEVLLVHRPRYDDWTLPKGKLEPGESHVDGALREVEEETGLRCALGPELASTSYTDRRQRPKTVRYWAMTPTSGRFTPTAEVDEVRWLGLDAAARLLSYDRDRAVLDALAATI